MPYKDPDQRRTYDRERRRRARAKIKAEKMAGVEGKTNPNLLLSFEPVMGKKGTTKPMNGGGI